MFLLKILQFFVFLFLMGCAPSLHQKYMDKDADFIYSDALENIFDNNLKKSKDVLDIISQYHPSSYYAIKADVLIAYVYYKQDLFLPTMDSVNKFLKNRPGNRFIPYMLYLAGISCFDNMRGVSRDAGFAIQAKMYFKELIESYPQTPYAKNAAMLLDVISDRMAAKELNTALINIRQGVYLPSLKRLEFVIFNYKNSNQLPEAWFRIMEVCHIINYGSLKLKAYEGLKNMLRDGKNINMVRFWLQKAQKLINS